MSNTIKIPADIETMTDEDLESLNLAAEGEADRRAKESKIPSAPSGTPTRAEQVVIDTTLAATLEGMTDDEIAGVIRTSRHELERRWLPSMENRHRYEKLYEKLREQKREKAAANRRSRSRKTKL